MTTAPLDPAIEEAFRKFKFYHIIPLNQSVSTPGNPTYVPMQQLCLKYLRRLELTGRRVLDVGCRDGLFSFEAEKLNAAEVIGIDSDVSPAATEFLIPFLRSKVKMHELNLYDLTPERFDLFDVIIFPGVLYHLRYPFWGLRCLRSVLKPGGTLLVETPILERDPNNAMLFCPIGADSPYEPTSCTFFNEKGMRDTLTSLGFTVEALEYLRPATPPRTRSIAYRLLRRAYRVTKTALGHDSPAPIRDVTRCVIQARLQHPGQGDFVPQYWDSTHRFHTQHGG